MIRMADIDIAQLNRTAAQMRGRVIEMVAASGAAHLASAMSCLDILVAAY